MKFDCRRPMLSIANLTTLTSPSFDRSCSDDCQAGSGSVTRVRRGRGVEGSHVHVSIIFGGWSMFLARAALSPASSRMISNR